MPKLKAIHIGEVGVLRWLGLVKADATRAGLAARGFIGVVDLRLTQRIKRVHQQPR